MSDFCTPKVRTLIERMSGLNQLAFNERLHRNSLIERWVIDLLNIHGIVLEDGFVLKDWNKCDDITDRTFKRDCFAIANNKVYTGQIKHRQPDSGSDFEIAIIQPYKGLVAFKQAVNERSNNLEKEVWARDYKFDGDFFPCMSNHFDLFRVVKAKRVKVIVQSILKEWWKSDNSLRTADTQNTFRSDVNQGAILKCTRDKGQNSWDSGVMKIMCYIPHSLFRRHDVVLSVSPGEPPDYCLE